MSAALQRLRDAATRLSLKEPLVDVSGKVVACSELRLDVVGVELAIGQQALVRTPAGEVLAEVIGFAEDRALLMPMADVHGLLPGSAVRAARPRGAGTGVEQLIGRVINGLGVALDGGPEVELSLSREHAPINPLERSLIEQPLDVGVRAINGLLTVGRGQRVGLMAGSGVGKSVLLGMISRHTEADVSVIALIGERGREVREFLEESLGAGGLERAIVVVATADNPPLVRRAAAELATAIAERLRDAGRHVLLLMDSLTRYAQAQREVALTGGEPPATKGYPPSVFALLPALVERAGNSGGCGSLTAIYTVLAEGDDGSDPVVDAARAVLDGHIVLSRPLAESGLYPAIDLESSISRVMDRIVDAEQARMAREVRAAWARYQKERDLLLVGAYEQGRDAALDAAVRLQPEIERYIRQPPGEQSTLATSRVELERLLGSAPATL